jgi:hypothetical protein
MNLKSLITSLTLSFVFVNAFSQVTLDLKERPKPMRTFNFRKISVNKNFIYNLGIDDKGDKSIYYIEKYNASTLDLEYQKDLKIFEDDKSALMHPLFVPPVCFESNGQVLAFYCGYDEDDKKVSVNVKTTNAQGDVNSTHITLFSFKDIEVRLKGLYINSLVKDKPLINYYFSADKGTVLIEIDSPKFKKIYSYAIPDLMNGKSEHGVYDLYDLCEAEKIEINKCFFVNNKVVFSYTKKTSIATKDFGFAVFDKITNSFKIKNLGLMASEVFSEDYNINLTEDRIFVSGYLRYPINSEKSLSIANSKVKQFSSYFNLTTLDFENKNEFDFLPSIAKFISVPKISYGFIDKTQTPDHYLDNMGLIASANYYYKISQIVMGSAPVESDHMDPMKVGKYKYDASGITTVCRDILVSKFDKSGKFVNQYLLPHHTGFNTFAGSARGALFVFVNPQRNFNYGLNGDDLHFFYLDNKKNSYTQAAEYDPENTKKCTVNNGALIHMSIKGDKVEREMLQKKEHKCYFYSNQNLMTGNEIMLDLENGKKWSTLGRVIIN